MSRFRFVQVLLAGLGIGLMSAGSPVWAQQRPARQILDQTVETYRTLDHYYFEGIISVAMRSQGRQHGMDINLLLAGRAPNDLHLEVNGPQMQVTVISDGDSTWMYLPALQQFVRRSGPFDPSTAAGAVPDLLSEYRALGEQLRAVTLLREEAFPLTSGVRPSYVLHLEYEPRPSANGADSTHKTLWIDRDYGVILKDSTRALLSSPPPGSPFQGPVVIQETTRFSEARVGGQLSDSLFSFTPPAEAVEVDPGLEAGTPEEGAFSGRPAMDFTLNNLQGTPVSLKSLRGNVVVVNFWATWCGPCRMEMPVLEKLHREYEDRGLVVLGVDVAETAEDVRAYLQENGYTFPILLDPEADVAALYEALAIPMTLVIDREGIVVHHYVGALPEPVLRGALRDAGL